MHNHPFRLLSSSRSATALCTYNTPVADFFIHNFGCRATQADGAAIAAELAERGMAPAGSAEQAGLVILNTCTVTAAADQDARAAIRRIHRENPEAKILVTGCYAQRAPQEIAEMPGVTWVIGNSHKHEIGAIVAGQPGNAVSPEALALSSPAFTLVGDIFAHTELIAAPVFSIHDFSEKTRPNLKVQDGCDNRCSFCIIPSVRGRSRSMPLERVIQEAQRLADAGYTEVVLSGINLGRWGRDLSPRWRFEQLLRTLLTHTSVEKFRISSVEPMDWSGELIELVASSPRVARHAHVPLQSGSDRILRLMHRRYRPWHYAEKIRRIHEAMPDAAIGADVMTGFPGETEELFEQNRSFIEHLPFTYLHVFTYSSRPGTASAAMPGTVDVGVARERTRRLRELSAAKNLEFRRRFVGRSLEVVTLQSQEGEVTQALSDNYLKVSIKGRMEAGRWLHASISSITGEGLAGTA